MLLPNVAAGSRREVYFMTTPLSAHIHLGEGRSSAHALALDVSQSNVFTSSTYSTVNINTLKTPGE